MNLFYQIYLVCLIYMYIIENSNSPSHAPRRPKDTLQIPTFWQYKSNSKVLIQLIYIPKLLVVYMIQIYLLKMHIPQPCARRGHRLPPTDINHQLLAVYIQYQCIYPNVIYSPIVGIIYPIQIYIWLNVHSPTLRPKGAHTPYNWYKLQLLAV